MGTISSTIRMNNGMTPALKSMVTSMNLLISSFEQMRRASGKAINMGSLHSARETLAKTQIHLNQMEREIIESTNAQRNFNQELSKGEKSSGNLKKSIKGFIGAYVGMQTLRGGMQATDNSVSRNARISLINDGLQTQEQLQNKIYAAAERARGKYGEMVDIVGKMGLLAGEAFQGNDEMIRFTELMQKSFKISGASAMEQTSAMYQLTQAMAAGKLQGDEFRSIMENAPMLANAIAKYTGKSKGNLKELSSSGEITADIIKNAMFMAAEDIEDKYSQMPQTFAGIWNSMQNRAIMTFQTTMKRVNQFLNTPLGTQFLDNFNQSIQYAKFYIDAAVTSSLWLAKVITKNWSWIGPIIYIGVGALVAYKIATIAVATWTAVSTAAIGAKTMAMSLLAVATGKASLAQWGLNYALLACPIFWIIAAIVLVIGIIYVAVGAVNHFAGTSYSATGLIAGAFNALAMSIWNNVVYLYNIFAGFAEFFMNVWNHPLYSVRKLFGDWAINVLNIVRTLAKAIDAVFGSNLSSAIDGMKSKITTWEGATPQGYKVVRKLDMVSLDKAFKDGYAAGDNFANGWKKSDMPAMPGLPKVDPAPLGMGEKDRNGKKIKGDTGAIRDSLERSAEDLKYIRDMAAVNAINRFSFGGIKLDAKINFGDVHQETDLDGIGSYIEGILMEAVHGAMEGVPNV